MGNKGRSEPNIFGGYTHYDERGNKAGKSEPNVFGGYTNYDAKGNKVGRSDPSLFGGYNHYDSYGHKTGRSDPTAFGGYSHYDASGKKIGNSSPQPFGGYSNQSASGGCYIATCVYGSYDCPEVRTLRRFRDDTLAGSFWGRAFVKVYYALSPRLVKRFGENKQFRRFWRNMLDQWVCKLRQKGYDDSPYHDKRW